MYVCTTPFPILGNFTSTPLSSKSTPLTSSAWHSYMLHALKSHSHGGNTAACNCEAGIASLMLPREKNMSQSTKIAGNYGTISVIMTKHVLDKEECCHPQQQDSRPFPENLPNTPCIIFVSARLAHCDVSITLHHENIDNFTSTVCNCLVDHNSPLLLSDHPANRPNVL